MKSFTLKGFLKEFLCTLRADPPEPVLAWYLHAGTVGGQNSVALGTPRPRPAPARGKRGEKGRRRGGGKAEKGETADGELGGNGNECGHFFGTGRFGKREIGEYGEEAEEMRKRNCRAEQSGNEKTVSKGSVKS